MSNGDRQPDLFPGPRTETLNEAIRIVWVFRRSGAETRVAHIADERLLVVARPDAPVMQRRFATIDALVEFQTELEMGLRREGWTLHHVEPDRRARADRRVSPRSGPDRRRS